MGKVFRRVVKYKRVGGRKYYQCERELKIPEIIKIEEHCDKIGDGWCRIGARKSTKHTQTNRQTRKNTLTFLAEVLDEISKQKRRR